MPETFGGLVRSARKAAGLSLRALGEHLGGLSAPFIHDVEHDRRRLGTKHWGALCAALPGLTVRALAEAALAAGPIEVDARDLTAEQRARLVEALEAQAA
jgi:transcriptional regulator with XRE-family HTH domain